MHSNDELFFLVLSCRRPCRRTPSQFPVQPSASCLCGALSPAHPTGPPVLFVQCFLSTFFGAIFPPACSPLPLRPLVPVPFLHAHLPSDPIIRPSVHRWLIIFGLPPVTCVRRPVREQRCVAHILVASGWRRAVGSARAPRPQVGSVAALRPSAPPADHSQSAGLELEGARCPRSTCRPAARAPPSRRPLFAPAPLLGHTMKIAVLAFGLCLLATANAAGSGEAMLSGDNQARVNGLIWARGAAGAANTAAHWLAAPPCNLWPRRRRRICLTAGGWQIEPIQP